MVNKWVLSAYEINKGEKENQSTKSSNEQKSRKSTLQDKNLVGLTQMSNINTSKCDDNDIETLLKEMDKKDTLSSTVDKKVIKNEENFNVSISHVVKTKVTI